MFSPRFRQFLKRTLKVEYKPESKHLNKCNFNIDLWNVVTLMYLSKCYLQPIEISQTRADCQICYSNGIIRILLLRSFASLN